MMEKERENEYKENLMYQAMLEIRGELLEQQMFHI